MTNKHVLYDGPEYKIRNRLGYFSVQYLSLRTDTSVDVSIGLVLDRSSTVFTVDKGRIVDRIRPIKVSNSEITVGSQIFTINYGFFGSLLDSPSVSRGIISKLVKVERKPVIYGMDVTNFNGSSEKISRWRPCFGPEWAVSGDKHA